MSAAVRGGLAALVLLLAATPAAAQRGVPHGHGHGAGTPGGGEGHLRALACEREFDAVVAAGRGFGLAFAADRRRYPGPLHILELRERLALTPAQEARARALFAAMEVDARARAAGLAAAEARLVDLFASGRADEGAVRAAVADAERARAELRLAHLLVHLAARDLLTEAQRRLYHEARWPEPPGR